jgi:hypothetical protein
MGSFFYMTELKNIASNNFVFTCPDCGCKFGIPMEPVFWGIYTMADCVCDCCENPYDHSLATANAEEVFAVSGKTGKTTGNDALIRTITSGDLCHRAQVQALVWKEYKEVVLLNCLAATPDEVVQKMVHYYRIRQAHPERGLVVLLPACMAWLVPDGAAEVWIVEAPWAELGKRIVSLDKFVKEKLATYTSVWLADTSGIGRTALPDGYDFFKLSKQAQPYLTLVYRPDEYWFVLPSWLEKRKAHPLVKKVLRYRQKLFFRKLIRRVHRQTGKPIVFYVLGMAVPFLEQERNLSDLCTLEPDRQQYQHWLQIYAQSRLVLAQQAELLRVPQELAGEVLEVDVQQYPTASALARRIATVLSAKN